MSKLQSRTRAVQRWPLTSHLIPRINNLEYGIQIYDCENALNILDILSESSYRAIFITLSIEACTRRGQCQIFRTIYIQYRLLTYLTIYDIFTSVLQLHTSSLFDI